MSASKSQQKLSNRYSGSGVSGGSSGAKGTSGGSGKIMGFIVLALICVVGVVILFTVISDKDDAGVDANSYNLVVTPDNIEELKAQYAGATLAAGSYDVCMNSTWTFDNARSASKDAYVENILSNTNTVKFSLTRDDTGAVIYESPNIPVGSSLKNMKLTDESLTKGTYPCTVQYHLLDKDYKRISSVKVAVSVVIKED